MKKTLSLLTTAAILLLSACGSAMQPPVRPSAGAPPPATRIAAPDSPASGSAPPSIAASPDATAEPDEPDEPLDDIGTIEAYFERQYEGYLALEFINVSDLLDLNYQENRNLVAWLRTLTMRRQLIAQNDYCFVDTQRHDYWIEYEDEAEDERMEFWQNRGDDDYDAVYHLRIFGEEEQAYPPTFATNAQHTIFLKNTDGGWKITRHYYPGAVRSFRFSGTLVPPEPEELQAELEAEFAAGTPTNQAAAPKGTVSYDASLAVDYAMEYMAEPNPEFYNIGDWMGNCANFVSQAVSAGFGGEMHTRWFGGGGGGSPAWENVDYFWQFATQATGMGGLQLSSINDMQAGDVLQIRKKFVNKPEDYNHMIIMVDEYRQMFAQNSPASYVYYSDLVNAEMRMVRPRYIYK